MKLFMSLGLLTLALTSFGANLVENENQPTPTIKYVCVYVTNASVQYALELFVANPGQKLERVPTAYYKQLEDCFSQAKTANLSLNPKS
jgi:hypothetical protein